VDHIRNSGTEELELNEALRFAVELAFYRVISTLGFILAIQRETIHTVVCFPPRIEYLRRQSGSFFSI
jgi:hypothetical protein